LHDTEIVRDEEIGQVEIFLQLTQKIEDLGLDGDVESRDRLVADDQLGLRGERPGDADALPLGAAYTLKLDGELGSIETGKRADFAVLDGDPIAAGADGLKDVPVWGTVLGGRVFPCAAIPTC
jgi:hypothetical protein